MADEGEYLFTYTRAQAIADGVLIDVSEAARAAGFIIPTALTAALWADIEAIPPAKRGIWSVEGRLWDVLWMGFVAVRTHPHAHAPLCYRLLMRVAHTRAQHYTVKLVIGPGDAGEPVLTLMRPDED